MTESLRRSYWLYCDGVLQIQTDNPQILYRSFELDRYSVLCHLYPVHEKFEYRFEFYFKIRVWDAETKMIFSIVVLIPRSIPYDELIRYVERYDNIETMIRGDGMYRFPHRTGDMTDMDEKRYYNVLRL